jgi:hypothetical protein
MQISIHKGNASLTYKQTNKPTSEQTNNQASKHTNKYVDIASQHVAAKWLQTSKKANQQVHLQQTSGTMFCVMYVFNPNQSTESVHESKDQ